MFWIGREQSLLKRTDRACELPLYDRRRDATHETFAADGAQPIDHALGRDQLLSLEQIRGNGRVAAVEIVCINRWKEQGGDARQSGGK